ncbi:MAG: ImmA/IrrE family metallo-endopeptidase [Methylovulum sp.]|nr:ImmA/IrrE family metallo-endopeptidase [Methylovulum sp.]
MFNPIMLSIARKRRQLTKKKLAELAGVSQVTLTRIETGDTQDPDRKTIAAFAQVLSYPIDFFYIDKYEEITADAVSFRSLTSLTARQRDAALAAGVIAYLLDDWVSQRFNLPQPDLLDLRDEDPVAAALSLRQYWNIGSKPIKHMLKLLEAKGVRLFSLSESNKNVDAYSCWRNGVPYVFLNTFKSAERSRFDAAHELGHLVMHMHGASRSRDAERDADQFASAFLIPKDDLIANMPRVRSLEQLIIGKERWGVSVAALAKRSYDSNLLSQWHYRELCKQMSSLGYRTCEPKPKDREESVLWHKVFEALWRDRLTKNNVASELSIPLDEIESLIGGLCRAKPNPNPTISATHPFRLKMV